MADEKISLSADRLYIIRSRRERPDGQVTVRYYETPAVWNASPMEATVFQNYESGAAHLRMYHERDRPKRGWADGSVEVLDVVPLYGEIINSPNGVSIRIDRAGSQEGRDDG